jgi:hypothetical protein
VPEPLTSLLSDLHRVAGQLNDANGKVDVQLAAPETATPQPASPPGASESADGTRVEKIKGSSGRHVAGVVIGIDPKTNSTTLEQITVTPEANGRVSIIVRVRRDE